jgi:hypothetical protein
MKIWYEMEIKPTYILKTLQDTSFFLGDVLKQYSKKSLGSFRLYKRCEISHKIHYVH